MNQKTTTIADVAAFIESWAPASLAEDYDNVGLLVGSYHQPTENILVSLDVTESVVDEAIASNCGLIVSHHPILFKNIKRLNGQNYVARTVEKAIRNQIGLYACHTNLDNVSTGVNQKIGEKIGLSDLKILRPANSKLLKLTFFVPPSSKEEVLASVHAAGAGNIGNYTHCSFASSGTGTFRPGLDAHPTIGTPGQAENVAEDRVEVILPRYLKSKVIQALETSHPYEEVAYYIHPLENNWQDTGSGMVGSFSAPIENSRFIELLKKTFNLHMVKHTRPVGATIQKVAICGGSGHFLMADAIAAGADVFVTADLKYHEFFDADDRIMAVDIGHYESEQFTSELIIEQLSKQFPNIAVLLSKVRTNPVFYA